MVDYIISDSCIEISSKQCYEQTSITIGGSQDYLSSIHILNQLLYKNLISMRHKDFLLTGF